MQIGVVGAGFVGSVISYALTIGGVAEKIILIDVDKERARAEAMDISHALPFCDGGDVVAGEYKDLKDSDVIIITAGDNQKKGETRIDLLDKNVKIFKDIIPKIAQNAPNSILIIATNPVDIMTEVALRLSFFPKNRVFGTGTVLDSARFRSILGKQLGISSKSIHANVIGEHGDSEVLLWSGAVAGTSCVERIAKETNVVLDSSIKQKIDNDVRNSAYEIIKGKGATYFGIASAVLHIVRAILNDSHAILNISSHHDSYIDGVNDICYAMPSIIGKNGVEKILMPTMSEYEKNELIKSAKVLKEYMDKTSEMM